MTKPGILALLSLIAMTVCPGQGTSALTHVRRSGPFVVGGLCSGELGNSVTTHGSTLVVREGNSLDGNSSFSGWEVFTSNPGTHPGNITPSPTTTAPTGTYSFNVSGLPPGTRIEVGSIDALDNGNYVNVPISNGFFSIVAPPVRDPGSPLVAVNFWIYSPRGSSPIGTYTVSNFQVNHTPLAIDTTHLDNNNGNGAVNFSWCANF